MSSISVRSEDRLEGASNFSVWKLRIMNVLQELELEQFVTTVMEEPATNADRAAFRRNQAKAKRVIFYSLKDSIMPVKKEICMRRLHLVKREISRTSSSS
jgi:hypothetical protein